LDRDASTVASDNNNACAGTSLQSWSNRRAEGQPRQLQRLDRPVGAVIGAATTISVAGRPGGLLGAVGGAIAGTATDSSGGGSQRGIEVTVQKDDGQTVVVAQADNGDVQIGDRVRIVQDRNGAASAIRDSGYRRDIQKAATGVMTRFIRQNCNFSAHSTLTP
jgi:hypothetical protein